MVLNVKRACRIVNAEIVVYFTPVGRLFLIYLPSLQVIPTYPSIHPPRQVPALSKQISTSSVKHFLWLQGKLQPGPYLSSGHSVNVQQKMNCNDMVRNL